MVLNVPLVMMLPLRRSNNVLLVKLIRTAENLPKKTEAANWRRTHQQKKLLPQ